VKRESKIKVVFWSSTRSSAIFDPIILELNNSKFTAIHKYISPGYRNYTGIYILDRVIYRAVNYLFYPLWLVFSICRFNNQINIITTNPFFAPLICIPFKSKKKYIIALHWDIFPAALVVADKIKLNSFFYRFLQIAMNLVYKSADGNVFLGELILNNILSKTAIRNPYIIDVGSSFCEFLSPNFLDFPMPFINITYSGNLGFMHDIETLKLLIVSDEIKEINNVKIRFLAHGPRYRNLELFYKNSGSNLDISFNSGVYTSEWVDFMKKSHISLITMAPGAQEVVFPSKFYSSIAFGQAIIAIAPLDSDLANVINKYDLGWVVEPGDAFNLASIFLMISGDISILQKKRENCLKIYKEKYSSLSIADSWKHLLKSYPF